MNDRSRRPELGDDLRREVAFADRRTAGQHDGVAALERCSQRVAQRVRVVADARELHGLGAERGERRTDRVAIRIANLPERRRSGDIDQFITGRDDPEARAREHLDRRATERRQHAEFGCAEATAGRQDTLARAQVGRTLRQILPGRDLRAHHDRLAFEVDVFDRNHRVRAVGERAARGDAQRLVRIDRVRRRGTHSNFTDDRAAHAAAAENRKPVHRRTRMRGMIFARDRVARQDAPGRGAERDAFDRRRRDLDASEVRADRLRRREEPFGGETSFAARVAR